MSWLENLFKPKRSPNESSAEINSESERQRRERLKKLKASYENFREKLKAENHETGFYMGYAKFLGFIKKENVFNYLEKDGKKTYFGFSAAEVAEEFPKFEKGYPFKKEGPKNHQKRVIDFSALKDDENKNKKNTFNFSRNIEQNIEQFVNKPRNTNEKTDEIAANLNNYYDLEEQVKKAQADDEKAKSDFREKINLIEEKNKENSDELHKESLAKIQSMYEETISSTEPSKIRRSEPPKILRRIIKEPKKGIPPYEPIKPVEPTEPEEPEILDLEDDSEKERKDSAFWKKIKEKASRSFKASLAVSILLMGSALFNNDKGVSMKENLPKGWAKYAKDKENRKNKRNFDLKGNLPLYQNEVGDWQFNPVGLISPLGLEFDKDMDVKNELSTEISEIYAPHFVESVEAGRIVDPKNTDRAAAEFKKALAGETVSVLEGLDFSPNSLEKGKKFEINPAEITKIKIIGFASPEGPAEEGYQTILSGKDDSKNIELSGKRSDDFLMQLTPQLRESGVPQEVIDQIEVENGGEINFSELEMDKLSQIAWSLGYGTFVREEGIFEVITAYNDGKITNPEILTQLDEIIASKRMVKIQIETSTKQKQTLNIPIAIVILLPFAAEFIRKKKIVPPEPKRPDAPKEPGIPDEPGETEDTTELNPPTRIRRTTEKIREITYRRLRIIEITNNYTDEVFFDDILKNFHRRGMVSHSIKVNEREIYMDYEYICREIEKEVLDGKGSKEIEKTWSSRLLQMWSEYDLQMREDVKKEYGWHGDIKEGLDYENNERQQIYAKEHIRILTRLVKLKDELDLVDYDEALVMYEKRLIDKKKKGMDKETLKSFIPPGISFEFLDPEVEENLSKAFSSYFSQSSEKFEYFGEKRTLNYMELCAEIEAFKDKIPADEIEALFTSELLRLWRAKDLAARRASGDISEAGLDYLRDEKQKRYAKAHIRALLAIIENKKKYELRSYKESFEYLIYSMKLNTLKKQRASSQQE